MKHLFGTFLLGCAALNATAQYLPNSDFSSWKKTCDSSYAICDTEGLRQRPGVEPTGWNGSSVNQKVVMEAKKELIFNDNGAVKMANAYVGVKFLKLGSNAPAYLTLGTPWVYASMNIQDCDGGTYGGISFTHKPDAITGRFKRTDNTGENSYVIAYLWNGTFKSNIGSISNPNKEFDNVDRAILGKKEANANSDGKLVASCDTAFSTTGNDWATFTLPFNYVENAGEPTMLNVIVSAADYWDRSKIQEKTILYADDLQLLYYSEIEKMSVDNGKTFFQPVAGQTTEVEANYPMTAEERNQIIIQKKGTTATVNTIWDDRNSTLVVDVIGNDVETNTHRYTIQFAGASDAPTVIDYTNDLTVNVNGSVSAPQSTTIQLIKETDGSYSFALNDFCLGDLAVGDIKLTQLEVDGNHYSTTEQQVTITANPSHPAGIGPMLGLVPITLSADVVDGQMLAVIDINMMATLGQIIKVTIAPSFTIHEETSWNIPAGLGNITLNRSFESGWNTICLPFTTYTNNFGGDVKAQAFTATTEGALTFTEVSQMEANQPYLIYFPTAQHNPIYFGAQIEENTPQAVTFGDWTFIGTYTGVAAGELTGKYGVVANENGGQSIRKAGSQATIAGTRAYFEYQGTQVVNSMALQLEGTTTGIESLGSGSTALFPADIYSLDGRLLQTNAKSLNGLHKGIYIVNGKKIIVK